MLGTDVTKYILAALCCVNKCNLILWMYTAQSAGCRSVQCVAEFSYRVYVYVCFLIVPQSFIDAVIWIKYSCIL